MNLLQRFFGSSEPKKNVGATIVPAGLTRVRQDVLSWRDAIKEAEQSWYPQRVKLQTLFVDTIQNGHVFSCVDKRKNMTLQRDFEVKVNDQEVDDLEAIFKTKWFTDAVSYMLDAKLYGYSLISLGDCINNDFPELTLIKRENISPDRLVVAPFVYMTTGVPFTEEPYNTWHIYADTPSENGHSKCGYGLLYKVAMYEILCRNLIGYNATAAELYGMPIRHGKTHKTEADEVKEFDDALAYMGSAGWIRTDLQEEIIFVESKQSGNGHDIYGDLELRCEKKISKIILGHADAIDSVPGKLGNDSEESAAQKSLREIKLSDGEYIENIVNNQLIPKLRTIGFMIPEGAKFVYSNNDEKEAYRAKVDQSNKVTADIAKTMKDAGLSMDAKYFEERTGIPTEKVETPDVTPAKFNANLQNKLKKIYGN